MEAHSGYEIRTLLSKNLREFRLRRKLSQLALSTYTGLTHNFVNDIENGRKWVSPETLAKLACALEVEPYQLFLPDSALYEEDKTTLSGYFDEITHTFNNIVGEMRERYLQGDEEEP